MGGRQYQKSTNEPVYQLVFSHVFSANTALAVNTGAFPATGDKVALSAAQSSKVNSPMGLGITLGDIALDDANDRILLEPGVYEVIFQGRFVDAGTDSDFSFAMTTAAQAATDISETAVNGVVLSTAQKISYIKRFFLTVTASRALELHLAATTASGQINLLAGSRIDVRRLANPDQ